jgi:hypothetical protein
MNIKKQDIVFALLVGTIAYMIFRHKPEDKKDEKNTNPTGDRPNLEPRPIEVQESGETLPNSYRVTKDYVVKFTSPSNPTMTYNAVFKKGQVIQGIRYSIGTTTMEYKPFGKGKISTTPDGTMPDFMMAGGTWVEIPESILEAITPKYPTGALFIKDPNKASKPNKPSKFRLKDDFNTRGAILLNNKPEIIDVAFKKGEIFEGFLSINPNKVSIGRVGRPMVIDTEKGLSVRKQGILDTLFIPSEKLEQI